MFTFKLTPDDGQPVKVVAGSRDVLTWERAVRGASLTALLETRRMTDLYRIAHIAGRRLGVVAVDLPEFERTHDLEMVDDDEPDPTPPAP